jgi:hypothetical protein
LSTLNADFVVVELDKYLVEVKLIVIRLVVVVEEVGFLFEIHVMIPVVFDLDVEEVGSVVVKLEFVVEEVEFILAEVGFVIEIHRMTFVVVEIEFVKHMTVVEMKHSEPNDLFEVRTYDDETLNSSGYGRR